jgi:hypothetical protein
MFRSARNVDAIGGRGIPGCDGADELPRNTSGALDAPPRVLPFGCFRRYFFFAAFFAAFFAGAFLAAFLVAICLFSLFRWVASSLQNKLQLRNV